MTIDGLVMAGGLGKRMKMSDVSGPKPLSPVADKPLLRWATEWQLNAGIETLFVSVSSNQPAMAAALVREAAWTTERGVTLEVLTESEPQGNAGALIALRGRSERVLFSFADNLTDIAPEALIDSHVRSGCAATITIRDEQLQFPYGVVTLGEHRVIDYVEKPMRNFTMASGYAVFESEALEVLPVLGPLSFAEAIRHMIKGGLDVGAFRHSGLWVDVNDRGDASRAEAIMGRRESSNQMPSSIDLAPSWLGPTS